MIAVVDRIFQRWPPPYTPAHMLLLHHGIDILPLGCDVCVPSSWIWEELVTALTRRIQRKWCCASFWAKIFGNSQLPIPAFWDTESWKPATMLRETKYPYGEALYGCLDQQPLLSSQPIANINCQTCECRSLQMIPASSYRVTPSLPSWGFRLCRAEVSCPHNAFSKSLIHRIQKHNKMVVALCH